jgi:hypothetical protein
VVYHSGFLGEGDLKNVPTNFWVHDTFFCFAAPKYPSVLFLCLQPYLFLCSSVLCSAGAPNKGETNRHAEEEKSMATTLSLPLLYYYSRYMAINMRRKEIRRKNAQKNM